jgi:mycothiol synthase
MTTLPAPYLARPFTPADSAEVVNLINTYALATIGVKDFSLEEFQRQCQTDGFNPSSDILLAAAPDGRLVGYAEFWSPSDPHVHMFSYACVHPEHQGRGVGAALERWAEGRARQKVTLAPPGARVILTQGIPAGNLAAQRLVECAGYRLARTYWQMKIEMAAPPPAPCPPDGILIRAMQPGEERAVIRASAEAFRDHYGNVEEPFEQRVQRWKENFMTGEIFDPSIWFLALDGNEIAGMSICRPCWTEDPGMGLIATLGVRRPWRRRGLGLALLQHSFDAFYRRGVRKVGLGVDASSLTGATRLYEKAGMTVFRQNNSYVKEIRPGVELGTTTVEDE